MHRPIYRRAGIDCFIDRCRGYLVSATPEEAVRQAVLDRLIDELGVPETRVRSEFNQRRRGAQGRADVIVLAPGADDREGGVLMVVECKRPGAFLDDRTKEQAVRYAEPLGADVIVLTNGDDERVYSTSDDGWVRREAIPTWGDLLAEEYGQIVDEEKFQRWDWSDIGAMEAAERTAEEQGLRGWLIGEDSPAEMAPFALNLFGLLADEAEGPPVPLRSGDFVIEEDLGQRSRTFGNASGGMWPSDYYRSFLVFEEDRANYQVVSLAVLACAKVTDHPVWGNRRGRTMLVAALDEGTTSHVSLEMGLDEIFKAAPVRRTIDMTPVGKMTVGKRGALKQDVLLAELARHGAADLVRGDRVWLGCLPLTEEMTWQQSAEFIGNVVRYALVRDRIRSALK